MLHQFPNKVALPCSFHKTSNSTHICMDPQCNHHPYLCSYCLKDFSKSHSNHQYHITLIDDGINNITRSLHNYKAQFEKALSNSSKRYKVTELDNIINRLNLNVDEMKNKIQVMGEKLVSEFRFNIGNVKESLYQELDKYQKVRMATIQTYKESLAHYEKYNKLKFYANQSSLFLKLKTELNRKSTDWFNSMKKYISKSEDIIMESPNFLANLNQSVEEISMEQIGYVEDSISKQASRSLEDMAGTVLRQMVFVRSKSETFARKKFRAH